MSAEIVEQLLVSKTEGFALLSQHMLPSLTIRARDEDWYENRVIRYILDGSPWISELEGTFQEARLDTVCNSGEIFRVLKGTELDYDELLFDALTEVRLCRWARQNSFPSIEKLAAQSNHRTPDFRLERTGKVALAEAKHFRVRDYLVYHIADRLEGLAFVTGKLAQFGLQVETGDKYQANLDEIRKNRNQWLSKARQELTAHALSALDQRLHNAPDSEVPILDGLLVVRRSQAVGPGRVSPALMGSLSPAETVKWCLARLQDELLGKLRQIKEFKDAAGAQADQAIVFVSGIDEWEPEWAVVWETLDAGDEAAWKRVSAIKEAADQAIGILFELIVGKYQKKERGPNREVQYGPMQYAPFPWRHENIPR